MSEVLNLFQVLPSLNFSPIQGAVVFLFKHLFLITALKKYQWKFMERQCEEDSHIGI